MNRDQIIRAWKDEEYRSTLQHEESRLMPEHPAGVITLNSAELGDVAAQYEESRATERMYTFGCNCEGGVFSWFFTCSDMCGPENPTFDYSCK